jgi:hypothetical protein
MKRGRKTGRSKVISLAGSAVPTRRFYHQEDLRIREITVVARPLI